MSARTLIVGLAAVGILGYGAWTALPSASQPSAATQARLSLRCGSHNALQRLAIFKMYVCTVNISAANGDIPRLTLDFDHIERWATLGDDSGKLGWNEADADYAPQRVKGRGMAVDFGVTASEVHFMFRPIKVGPHTLAIQGYTGTWRKGQPWLVSRLQGARIDQHTIVR